MNRRRFFGTLCALPLVPAIASAAPSGVMTMVSGPNAGAQFRILGTITRESEWFALGDPRTYPRMYFADRGLLA